MKVRAYALSHIGMVREENQDAFLSDEQNGLFIVADGMGGLENGALAANYVVRKLANLLEEALEKNRNQEITKAKIKQALLKVNRELPSMVGVNSGSTVVLLNIKGEECLTANLGDSQAFLVRGDTITNLTVEHNLAGVMVELGKLSPEQARVHPLRNYLTAFLGMDAKELPVHFAKINLQNDDRILICTDGLTGMVPEETIKNIIKSELDLETAVHKLVDMANQAGGWDNTTLVLVEISKY